MTLQKLKNIKYIRRIRGTICILLVIGVAYATYTYNIHKNDKVLVECDLEEYSFNRVYSNDKLVFENKTSKVEAPIGLVISGTMKYYPCTEQIVSIIVTDNIISTRDNISYNPIGENQVRKLR
ncbi:MAG: hypothetical protein KDH96_03955 [Candidatus Riesia sp.]|nr:hypothetical protein [Candidatus Riesia sp.]